MKKHTSTQVNKNFKSLKSKPKQNINLRCWVKEHQHKFWHTQKTLADSIKTEYRNDDKKNHSKITLIRARTKQTRKKTRTDHFLK